MQCRGADSYLPIASIALAEQSRAGRRSKQNHSRDKPSPEASVLPVHICRAARGRQGLGGHRWVHGMTRNAHFQKSIDCERTCFASLNSGGRRQMGWEGARKRRRTARLGAGARARVARFEVKGSGEVLFITAAAFALLDCFVALHQHQKRPRRRRLHSPKSDPADLRVLGTAVEHPLGNTDEVGIQPLQCASTTYTWAPCT
jgi:hypothetical protein